MKTLTSLACIVIIIALPLSAQAQKGGPIISPEIIQNKEVTFRLKAPKAAEVSLRGQWDRQQVALTKDAEGVWSITLPEVKAGVWEYNFIVDGLSMIDPANTAMKPQRSPNTSILHITGSPARVWDFQDVPHGTVHQHSHFSKSLGKERQVWVYTPPGYETSGAEKYPLLVLQHGSGDRHETWVTHGKAHWILDNLIAAKTAVPMVVMMIDGHPLGMVPRDQADRRSASLAAFKTELLSEALPLVEQLYRVRPEREQRAITGLSMGGWQSLSTGMTQLDKFAWIGSFSGAVDEKEIQSALDDPAGTNAKLKLLWIACGEKDFLLERNEQLLTTLKAKGIQHEWRLTPGDHSWPVWRDYLAEFAPKLFR
jgi:enterochelin esterase family protein